MEINNKGVDMPSTSIDPEVTKANDQRRAFLQRRRDRERWVERTFTVRLDVGTYGSEPDADEIVYLLRMGGIDCELPRG